MILKKSDRPRLIGFLLVTLLAILTPWSSRAQETPPQDGPQIHLQGGSFDPLALPQPEAQPGLTSGAGEYLLQFSGPVLDEWVAAVEGAGARLYGYIPDFAYIASLDGPALEQVRSLPFVRWVGPYAPAYRLSTGLVEIPAGEQAPEAGTAPLLSVQTLPDADLAALQVGVEALGGTVAASSTTALAGYLQVSLDPAQAGRLAALPGVVWVEPFSPLELTNSSAGESIMNVGSTRLSLNLYGKGQVIGIADTGLDTGKLETLHPDLAGRVLRTFCLGRPAPCDWGDPDGHGTHVAGSAVGNGAGSRSPAEKFPYQGSFAGTAPQAQLVYQSVLDIYGKLGGIPYDNGELMRSAYRAGARIHSNSWGGLTAGGNGRGGYNVNSQQIDQAAWELKDLLILFASGNSGVDGGGSQSPDGLVDPDSLLSPGTAKNALTIGASESLRTSGGYGSLTWALFGFRTPPLSDDLLSDNPSGMAAFSSRGPADDGRVKPDLVAPGTNIISVRSRYVDSSGRSARTGWGIYDDQYVYMGGTSMSTPLVAGAAALAREWLSRTLANPSGALIKALLINGGANISPGQYQNLAEVPSGRPNFVSGWGRVDLHASLQPDGQSVWLKDQPAGARTGDEIKFQLKLGRPGITGTSSRPLRLTLVWNDYPGSLSAAKALVNDLDLELVAPDGKRYVGNAGLYASGSCLRAEKWDACNNVEGLALIGAPFGTYTVIVRGYNIPKGPQPFALAASGELLRDDSTDLFQVFAPIVGK